jgi:hypothetical protein
MIADAALPVQIGQTPTDLVRLTVVAKRGPMSLPTLHRWRLRETDPLPCWRLGGVWYVSESELAEWIARRSGRASAPATAVPAMTATRRREVERAMAECRALRP